MQPLKGLHAYIYRQGTDCSNGGISSRCDAVTIVGEGIPEVFSAREDAPAVRVVRRQFASGQYVHLEPVDQPAGMCGPMFGGTLVYSSDSRFRELVSPYAVSLHDRFDTWEDYRAMSL